MKIIGQQGETRFLIDAGTVPDGAVNAGLPAARIYDAATGKLSDPLAVGAITAHSPGWEKPSASSVFLDSVSDRVAELLPAATSP